MPASRGQRVVGWFCGGRSAWIERLFHDGKPWGYNVFTRESFAAPAQGDLCFLFAEAECLAKTFVAWPE